jgi:cytochrome c oxidase subunit III
MKVAGIEQLTTIAKKPTIIGGGSGDNSANDGGNGGDIQKNNPFGDNLNEFKPEKFRILTWFLLLIVFMTFGGLIGAYLVLSANKALEWKPFDLPYQIWISTALIIASTICYEISNRFLKAENQPKSRTWVLTSTVLGGMFIASQFLAWLQLVNKGVYVSGNPFAGLFYILTATHALHVLGGIIALGYIVLKTKKPTFSDEELFKRQTYSKVVGWYWHFMDVLWLVLVFLLGFWR